MIRATPHDALRAITILPVMQDGDRSLVAQPIRITDAETLRAINRALQSAVRHQPEHPTAEWEALVRFETDAKAVRFLVVQTNEPRNGTIIDVYSDGGSGWLLGTFRSDAIGEILMSNAKNEERRTAQ